MANSTQTATSDGNLELLNLSIEYLDRSEISVFFDSLPTTAWEWVGITDKTIKFTPKVPAGVQVLVRRTTDSSQLRHTYSRGAAFTAPTLDESLSQVLHIAQEAQESNLSADFFSDVNMHGNRVVNSFPGVAENDVATVGQVLALSAPSVAAAEASADASASSASAAAVSANAAAISAGAAQVSAESAAASLADTVRRDGSVAMTAELTLAGNASNPLGAVPKQQAESIATAVSTPIASAAAAAAVANRMQYSIMGRQNATGAAVDFTGIPTWAQRITLFSDDVSTNGNSILQARLQTSGGFTTAGYAGNYAYFAAGPNISGALIGTSFALDSFGAPTDRRMGVATFYKVPGTNRWQMTSSAGLAQAVAGGIASGAVTLPGVLTGIRVFTNSADVLDGGALHLLIEG